MPSNIHHLVLAWQRGYFKFPKHIKPMCVLCSSLNTCLGKKEKKSRLYPFGKINKCTSDNQGTGGNGEGD